MRSNWKLKPVEFSFFRYSGRPEFKSVIESKKIWAKGTRVFFNLLEKNIQVYNGGRFVDLLIKPEMLGSFIGSLVLSKRITADIHSKTRKNKRGKLNRKKK